VLINSINKSRDAIFDENRFSSVPRPSLRVLNGTEYIGVSEVSDEVPSEVTKEFADEILVQQPEPEAELRKSKRHRIPKSFGPKFLLYKIKGTRDEKEAINDDIDSIMGINAWVLPNLPLGCKWIFKRKLKVDETIKKFKASGTYEYRKTVGCFGINSQSDYSSDETSFLNGELDKEAPKQWHQKFNEVVLSNGYVLNQANKYVYINLMNLGSKRRVFAVLRREAWPPHYEMDQGVDSGRGGFKRRVFAVLRREAWPPHYEMDQGVDSGRDSLVPVVRERFSAPLQYVSDSINGAVVNVNIRKNHLGSQS
nr:hypothetical protein [Tanacetum cinerariifolium]